MGRHVVWRPARAALGPRSAPAWPVRLTPRFSVARALVEGEYYDKLLEQATSPTRVQQAVQQEDDMPALS